jgi:regulator of nonsense transcripts 2
MVRFWGYLFSLTVAEGGMPKPNSENPLDAPNDWFRIRLICILLETCASFFDKGPAKKKLDFFITFFQVSI